MENKKKTNWFKITIIVLFVIYISLYGLNKSGYYDGSIRKKVEFTKEQIEQFENDVANGENIDLANYLKDQNKDYSNSASRLGYAISTNIESFLNRGIKDMIKFLGKLLS